MNTAKNLEDLLKMVRTTPKENMMDPYDWNEPDDVERDNQDAWANNLRQEDMIDEDHPLLDNPPEQLLPELFTAGGTTEDGVRWDGAKEKDDGTDSV